MASEYGIHVPSRDSLQEIETSSRLRAEGQVLYVSMPLATQDDATGLAPMPLGIILSRQQLVTVRYSEVHAIAEIRARVDKGVCQGSAAVFVALIDGMVDFIADMLEKLSRDLASVSARECCRHRRQPALAHPRERTGPAAHCRLRRRNDHGLAASGIKGAPENRTPGSHLAG